MEVLKLLKEVEVGSEVAEEREAKKWLRMRRGRAGLRWTVKKSTGPWQTFRNGYGGNS